MVHQQKIKFEIGDRVVFNMRYINTFKIETAYKEDAVQHYRRLVLAGLDQVGIVIACGPGENLTTIAYPDGWNLPLPTMYLELVNK